MYTLTVALHLVATVLVTILTKLNFLKSMFTNLPPHYNLVMSVISSLFTFSEICPNSLHAEITDGRSYIFSHVKSVPLSSFFATSFVVGRSETGRKKN